VEKLGFKPHENTANTLQTIAQAILRPICVSNENDCPKLVHQYLVKTGRGDIAAKLAATVGFRPNDNAAELDDLEKIVAEYLPAAKVGLDCETKPRRCGWYEELSKTMSQNAEFTLIKGQYGGAVLQYKDYDHNFQRMKKGEVADFMCAYRHSSCKGCQGAVVVNWKTGKVLTFKNHSHASSIGKMAVSSMGTDDHDIKYSRSLRGAQVLHYRGYEYLTQRWTKGYGGNKVRQPLSDDGRQRWACRQQVKMKCQGHLFTRNGQLVGDVKEHTHLPVDTNPRVKAEANKMVTPLFF